MVKQPLSRTEGIAVTEVQLVDPETDLSRPKRADILLLVGCFGAIIICMATLVLAVYAFARSDFAIGFLYFPLGFLMAAANATLFWRVYLLSQMNRNVEE